VDGPAAGQRGAVRPEAAAGGKARPAAGQGRPASFKGTPGRLLLTRQPGWATVVSTLAFGLVSSSGPDGGRCPAMLRILATRGNVRQNANTARPAT
jgi:hypothetical protein